MVEKSNSSIEQNIVGRAKLNLFKGFAPSGESLRPGYAYLIRSRVRMTELYPLLGEILFSSTVKEFDVGTEHEGRDKKSPNVIGMFIEDSLDTLVFHLNSPDKYIKEFSDENSFLDIFLKMSISKKKKIPDYAAWLDTYGNFVRKNDGIKYIHHNGKKWWRQSIPGAGNPMLMMRFLRRVQKHEGNSNLNLFLLSSLSNLYRNLGLSESSAFLKAILGQIWVEQSKDSIFFAVMQEGVLDFKEASYLESFFDGIISVMPCRYKQYRVVRVSVEVLPELVECHNDFIFLPKWQFEDNNIVPEYCWQKHDYISVREVTPKLSDKLQCQGNASNITNH